MLQKFKRKIKKLTGYQSTNWSRLVMYREFGALFREIRSETLDALEVSGDVGASLGTRFKSFRRADYPGYDVSRDRLDSAFDLIICDQVFEHIADPYAAGKNVLTMLRPGGYFLISTPFLIKIHNYPIDCTRWTPLGMRHFLMACGFPGENIRAFSWGNRACVKASFTRFPRYGWGFFKPLANEPEFPVVVWALARKGPA